MQRGQGGTDIRVSGDLILTVDVSRVHCGHCRLCTSALPADFLLVAIVEAKAAGEEA